MKFTKMLESETTIVYMYGNGDSIADIPALARRVSDRHFGVGSDGLILIDPSDRYDFRMRMYNADGTESAMCGNGSRCVGKYVYDKGHTGKTEIDLETGAGVRHLTLFPENGKVKSVRVDMGTPELSPVRIPVDHAGDRVVDMPFYLGADVFRITCVSMGNPHAVMFVDDVDKIDLEGIGKVLECHPFFPQRTNVEFIQVINPGELRMRVWERGTGETMACGTGACASLVAGVLNGKCERKAVLHLLGGDLQVEWGADHHVYMTGAAETVFEGELYEL